MGGNTVIVTICVVYFLVMIGTGIYASRKNKKASDFLVAGRKLNAPMTAITLAAVQIGVGIVLSSATNGYNEGVWPGIYYSIGCGGGLILAGLLTARKLRQEEGYVPLDYFAKRYGDSKGIRFWAWISNVPSLLGIFIAQLLACGGMWGVVLTDVIQTGIIIVGIPILAIATLIQFMHAGGSIADIYMTPFIPQGMGTKFIYLVLPFFLSISVSYDAYARIQSAKDAKTATKGCIWGGVIVIVIGLLCSTIGAASTILFPGVTDGIFTIAATGVLHPVLAGIVIAAILSAAMSSANCVILSLGASFSRDFYNKFLHPEVENLDELPKAKLISRAAVFGGSIAGILFAFKMTDILDAMIIFNYPYMGSMLVPLLGGLLWKGATRKGAFAAAIAGGIVGVVSFFIGIPGPLYGIINVDLSLMIAYLVSAAALVIFSSLDKDGKKVHV